MFCLTVWILSVFFLFSSLLHHNSRCIQLNWCDALLMECDGKMHSGGINNLSWNGMECKTLEKVEKWKNLDSTSWIIPSNFYKPNIYSVAFRLVWRQARIEESIHNDEAEIWFQIERVQNYWKLHCHFIGSHRPKKCGEK